MYFNVEIIDQNTPGANCCMPINTDEDLNIILGNFLKGPKGDPLTYEDLTEEQIKNLQQPAIDAAEVANTAADNANTAAFNAAQSANTAAGNVNTAITNAETATTNATNAASTATSAAQSANNAASNANTATTDANAAANTANTAATNADNATIAANTAATNAQNVANTYASQLANKVDKVEGKGLSKNDFTDELKNKLDNVESGAQKNVNADWNSSFGDSEIKNKPTLGALAEKSVVDITDINATGTPSSSTTLHGDGTWKASGVWGSISGDISSQTDLKNAFDSKVDNNRVQTDVPVNAKFTDTVYTHPTTPGNKHIPSGGSANQILRYSASGTAVWSNENDTIYSNATVSADGLMSKEDKSKLNNIEAGANNYTLPADVVQDASYVHTDNNYTTIEKDKLAGIPDNAKFTDTTYSEITETEIDAGTAATLRTITARRITFILGKVTTMISNAISALTKTDVGLGNVDNVKQIPLSQKGSNNGVAELDASGKVPANQLPSFVDDVLEFANLASFPQSGEADKIYVDKATNKTYRWGGTGYVQLNEGVVLGETSTTAYRGDRGKTAYDHSQAAHAPADAQKNVQSDYSVDDPDDDAYIKNKVTKVSQLENDQQFVKQNDLDEELNEIRDILNDALYFYSDQWYGVMRTKESLDSKLIRIGNFNLHRDLPLQNKLKRFIANPDGTVKYYLHPNDSRLKEDGTPAIIDSTDGNVMLEVPEHYVYYTERGNEMIYAISEHNLPGFVKVPRRVISAFFSTVDNINDKVVSGCFLTWNGNEIARDANNLPIFTDNAAQFRGGENNADKDGTVQSDLGMCRTNIDKNTMRGKCVGTSHLGGFRAYNTIRWFQRIEYANTNCQLGFNPELTADGFKQGGLGNTTYFSGAEWNAHNGYYPFIPNGITAVLGNNSGLVDYELQMASGTKLFKAHSYRGFEFPYGYIAQYVDDLLAYKIGLSFNRAYVCDDPTKFTSPADTQTEVPDGYVLRGTLPLETCYPLYEKVNPETGLSFPFIAGGSNATGMCDLYVCESEDANGWYTALVAGSGGSATGFGYLRTNERSSTVYSVFGFRLCYD